MTNDDYAKQLAALIEELTELQAAYIDDPILAQEKRARIATIRQQISKLEADKRRAHCRRTYGSLPIALPPRKR